MPNIGGRQAKKSLETKNWNQKKKLGAKLVRQPEEICVAGNRNERPAPSRFPKQRRSNPKNDVYINF